MEIKAHKRHVFGWYAEYDTPDGRRLARGYNRWEAERLARKRQRVAFWGVVPKG